MAYGAPFHRWFALRAASCALTAWLAFVTDFRKRLSALLNHKAARTTPVSHHPGSPAPTYFLTKPPPPARLERAVIRADVEHEDGRRASALFHLAHHYPPGGGGYWLLRSIEPADTS